MTSIWDDGSAHFFARDWPAVAYAAKQSWKPVRNDNESFDRDFSFLMFGNEKRSLLDCISTVSELKNTKTIENLGTTFFQEYLLGQDGQVHYLNSRESEVISRIIQEGISCLDSITGPSEESSNVWAQDIAAWHFALDQIAMQMSNYEKLIQLSDLYTKGQLSMISSELETLIAGWKETKERFSTLWMQENRSYWLDEETKIFDRKIRSLSDLKRGIDSIAQNQASLPSAASMGIDVRPLNKEYFTYWLISEKFEASNVSGIDRDFLSELGGEDKAIPTPYDWTKHQSPYAYKIDFENVDGNYIVYLYSRIETEESIELSPEIDFSGKWKMILNGSEVLDNNLKDHRILLKKGKNHVILKLQLEPEMNQIRFNLKNSHTTNKKYKYKLITE